jgi:hypothetical protein
MNKEEFLTALASVDPNQTDWSYSLISKLTDKFAQGYFSRLLEELHNIYEEDDPEFLDSIQIAARTYDIWNK